ncbi:hypothetical protein BSL78_00607 [Apostichopus japonicus]|uniref:Ig-like domain-containing protein n=1 Tax=Stichopus japonicus TaxID=307972 RepID=A0A2G8LQ62_STIJA|nr:hypothetical protein BSL78_00607 [Apostichopus japonicus]
MAPRRLNSYVILVVILLALDSLFIAAVEELTFGPEDPDVNEVIFEGENVTLICRVTDVTAGESVTFNVTLGDTNIIINNEDVSDGAISQFETMDNEIRFVLPAVQVDNLVWIKTDSNGITSQLTSDLTVITVSDSVKDGTLIDITCNAFIFPTNIPYTLTLTVGDPIVTSTLPSITMQTVSEGPGTNETPNQPLSTMLLVIIAGTGVAFILAVVLSVILCYCMCKKGEVVENEQQDFTVLYGKVLRRSQRSNDRTLDRNNTRSSEYSKPVTYDNNGGVSSSQSLTNHEDNNTDDNNVTISLPDNKYDRVNHDVDENQDDELDDVPHNPDYY